MYKYIIFFITGLLVSVTSQNKKGSMSLLTTNTARTLNPGQFTIDAGMNFFTKASAVNTSAAFNFWQINGDIALSYGISEKIDIAIVSNLYQDTQGSEANFPSSIGITPKIGQLELSGRSFLMSANLGLVFGIGEESNVPFENYVSEGMTLDPSLTFSYYSDQFLPERAINVHLTLGYALHFDKGNDISFTNVQYLATENSSKLRYSLGLVFPLELFDILFEIDGYTYGTKPSVYVYGREDRMVANLGFRYNVSNWLNFDFGLGFNVSEGAEETLNTAVATGPPVLLTSNSDLAGYSNWRGFMGFNFSLQSAGTYSTSRTEIERNEYQRRIQTFKGLIEEENNAEAIQKELETLKEERQKAEKELEELKKILDDNRK